MSKNMLQYTILLKLILSDISCMTVERSSPQTLLCSFNVARALYDTAPIFPGETKLIECKFMHISNFQLDDVKRLIHDLFSCS